MSSGSSVYLNRYQKDGILIFILILYIFLHVDIPPSVSARAINLQVAENDELDRSCVSVL